MQGGRIIIYAGNYYARGRIIIYASNYYARGQQGAASLYMQVITIQGGRVIIYAGNFYARRPQEAAVQRPKLRHKYVRVATKFPNI